MKTQHRKAQLNPNNINQSCPSKIQDDITRSVNQPGTPFFYTQDFRPVRSQQLLPHQIHQQQQINQPQPKLNHKQAQNNQNPHKKENHEQKNQIIINNKKGTNFDCQKVQSVELSQEEEIYRSISLKSRNNKKSQIQAEQLVSEKKNFIEKNNQKQSKTKTQELKQDCLNVLVAGAEDTGKTTFISCFKKKYRRNNESHIKQRTKQIAYEFGIIDQNLANPRNTVHFIDFGGFSDDQMDKYTRQIKQYAVNQWKNYQKKTQEDKRIHCCLYFLRGSRIKNSDIQVMKNLSQLFVIIPVIAKSDQYTKQQILQMKNDFNQKIEMAGQISLYDFEQFYRLKLGVQKVEQATVSKFGKFPPFVITTSFEKQNQHSGGFVREYPWGKVDIQNDEHTDFQKLCELLSRDIKSQLINKLIHLAQEAEPEDVKHLAGIMRQEEVNLYFNSKKRQKCNDKFIQVTLILAIIGVGIFYRQLKAK